ncbi:MAG: hypothetical protein V1791_01925, partial [Pseudomonadota bacterium]
GNTPVGVVTGAQGDDLYSLAARLLLRYTRAEPNSKCRMEVRVNGETRVFPVNNDLNESMVESYLVA